MSSKIKKRIEKPWAVYGLITKFIGRVIGECKGGVDLKYSEGQLFASQLWSSYAIERFSTSEEAINYLLSMNHNYSKKGLTQKVFEDFPKTVRKESLQQIHDTLTAYVLQMFRAQSKPKRKRKLKQLERIRDCGSPDEYDSV